LRSNSRLVALARDHHRHLADTLGVLAAHRVFPSAAIYMNGIFNPAFVTSTAWQTAHETGALSDLPLPLVLSVASAYETQDRYRTLAEALSASLLTEVRHDGTDVVLRQRFAQFITLDADFANRERVLMGRYGTALAALDSVPGR
jgi:hypothetical protein